MFAQTKTTNLRSKLNHLGTVAQIKRDKLMNKLYVAGLLSATLSTSAFAATEITWWHAMGGQLGETVNQIASDFNAQQDKYVITPVY